MVCRCTPPPRLWLVPATCAQSRRLEPEASSFIAEFKGHMTKAVSVNAAQAHSRTVQRLSVAAFVHHVSHHIDDLRLVLYSHV